MSDLKRYRVYLTEVSEFISAEHPNGEWVKAEETEAALADLRAAIAGRDARIAELEAALKDIEKCSRCIVSRLIAREVLGMFDETIKKEEGGSNEE